MDYAKAIGIILVVYGHVARGLTNGGISLPQPFFAMADSVVYSFHMPLFFFLSGLFFFETLSKFGGKQLVLKKLDTIVYPYVLWSLLQGGIEVVLSGQTNAGASASDVLSLLWAPRAQFWFLYTLFFTFVIGSAIYLVVPQNINSLVFAGAILLYLFPPAFVDFWVVKYLSRYFVFFSFGVFFAAYLSQKKLLCWRFFACVLVAFVLGQWFFHDQLGLNYTSRSLCALILSLVSILFVVLLSMYLATRSHAFLAYLGASSMAIYLMHVLAGSGVRIFMSKFLLVDSPLVHLAIGFVAALLIPLLALRLMHKLSIPYVFSAPLGRWVSSGYAKIFPPIAR